MFWYLICYALLTLLFLFADFIISYGTNNDTVDEDSAVDNDNNDNNNNGNISSGDDDVDSNSDNKKIW